MEKNLILAKAQGAVVSRDFTTAARLYKQLLQDDASNVNYLTEIGSIYVKAGEDEKAIPYYEQILTFYPHYIEAMNSLGAIYRRLKRYEESIQILQRAIDEGRQTASVNYNLGFTYKEMGNYNDAIDAFELVIAENPDDVLAYNHLGSIYFAKKDYQKSIQSYKRGLQIDQNHPILNYNLARCYEAAKNIPDAIRCYSSALKTRPGWNDAIRDFSSLLISCQKNKEAQDVVQQAINLHPSDGNLLCILGQIYLNQFDYDNAQKTFQKAYSFKSDDVKILMGLSKSYEKGEKSEKALDIAQKAMDLEPENTDVQKQYVHTLLSTKKYDQAYEHMQDLNEQTGGKDTGVLDLYGQYYLCTENEAKAQECYQKIQKINHHYKDYMLEAAERLNQMGKYDDAEKYAKQYVERRSQNPEGYNQLGKIYTKKGDLENAKAQFDKSLSLRTPNVMADSQIKTLSQKIAEIQAAQPVVEKTAEPVVEEKPVEEKLQENVQENPSDEFDFNSMGDNVPMGEALVEEEEDFFEDDPEEEALKKQQEEAEQALKDEEEPDFYFPPVAPAPAPNLSDLSKNDEETDPFDLFDKENAEEAANGNNSGSSGYDDGTGNDGGMGDSSYGNPDLSSDSAESDLSPAARIPEMPADNPDADMGRKFQQQAIDSASDAMEAAFNAQRLAQTLADQQLKMMEETQKMINAQMEQAAALQNARMSASEPENQSAKEPSFESGVENEIPSEKLPETEEKLVNEDVSETAAESLIDEETETPLAAEKESPSPVNATGDLLEKIQRILSDTDSAKKYQNEIELFKKLKIMCNYLPETEKDDFLSCRIRMQIEYIIAKLSGKPGLLVTAGSLLKSGALGDQYSAESDDEPFYLTNEVLSNMFRLLKKMAAGLEDQNLAQALCASADLILERIELENQKSAIF